MKDQLKISGHVKVYINDELVQESNNLVVTAGKEWIASRMNSASAAVMSHMAIGDNTTAAADGDTALGNEISRLALNTAGGTVSTNTVTYETTWAADVPDVTAPATTTITEAGIFNATSAGTMLARVVFGTVSKAETDSMTISWVITIS